MKTILNLIITTLGVLFILSACGGGGGDFTLGFEERTCTNNPFSDDCGDSGQATRTDAITDCAEKGECDAVPENLQTCLTDLFSTDCDAVAETIKTRTTVTVAELRMTFCEANKGDKNCPVTTPDPNPDPKPEPTLVEICTGDPFNSRCLTDYNEAREIACRGDTKEDCTATITRFCETEATPENGNTLNSLCGAVKYNTPREAACRTGNHDSLCGATIMRYCEVDATSNPDNTFNPLCNDNQTAMGVRDAFCMDTTNNNANPFSMRCANNAMGLTARNNYCGVMATDATSPAFADMRCVDDAKGIEVRNTYCVMGGDDLTGNAFKAECALNPDAQAILLAASECMTATADCLPSLRIICEAEVASFNTLCGDARTNLCTDGAPLLTESLCSGSTYEMGRETACVGGVTGIAAECDTLYTKHCGAGAENPFDMTAGETDMINCLTIRSQTNFALVRQTLCGNSRPAPSSKFEAGCNDLIVGLCTAKPYDKEVGAANYNCFKDEAFIPQRRQKRETCRVGTAADGLSCADLVALDPCVGDPFLSTCDAEEYKVERTARELYCDSGVAGTHAFGEGIVTAPEIVTNVDRLCGNFRMPICSWSLMSEASPRLNPTAAICPNNSQGLILELLYCSVGNNYNTNRSDCQNNESILAANCAGNPFHDTYQSVCVFGDNTIAPEMRRQRAKFCSGNVPAGDRNLCTGSGQNADDFLCVSSGGHANPFVDVCAGAKHDEARTDFLANCRNSDTSVLGGATSCDFVMSCRADPYGEDCVYHRPYYESRWAITEACEMLGVGEFNATCTSDIKARIQACLDTPYADGCKDNRDYDMVRLNFVNTCGDSKVVRVAGGVEDTRCRVAFDTFCVDDNLFTDTGANCLGDENYKPTRDLHFAECQKEASARAPLTDCTIASAQICQSAESDYTNPFLPLCDEDGRSSLVPRQELILRCQPLNTATRAEMGNEGCEIAKAKRILTNCDDNPFHADCNDYISRGQAYFDKRTERVMACGEASETGARCDGTQARLCVSNTAEAAPLSPACDNEADIADTRNDFLEACAGSDAGVRNCTADFAMDVKTACDADPYDSAVSTADGSTVNCVEFDVYDTARATRLSECETSQSTVCDETIKIICGAAYEDTNPFHPTLCDDIDADVLATAKRDFCQIRANVDNDECAGEGKALTRPTTASVLAERGTELGATPTAGMGQTNEFLKGTDDGLNTAGFLQANGDDAEVITIDMATAEYDGEPLGFEAADGIAFFVGHAPDNSFRVEYYAGILAGADLGAALTHVADTKVNWYGAINWAIAIRGGKGFLYHDQTAIGTTTRDFVLEIDLDAREFRSFFQRTGATFNDRAQGFLLTGGYDENTGVITDGKVLFGVRSGDEILRNGESGATYHFEGPLIGIIGQEGALGVFYAQRSNDGQGDALGGGFVARPPRPDFFSWTVSAVDPAEAPLTIRKTAVGNTAEASFIRGGATALNVGTGVGLDGAPYTLTLADDYSLADSQDSRFGGNIVTLGGDESDGVSFAVDSDRLYSGLLSGTDVGVPLIASANYRGLIGILIHKEGVTSYEIAHDFYLNANFDGTFNNGSATFSNGILVLSGARFNKFGLISGTVTLGTSTGTLSGLIGVDGVVGSFISTTHTNGAFAGGFVAHTVHTSLTPRARERAIWRANAVTDDGTVLDVLAGGAAVGSGNPPTNFIVGGTNVLEFSSHAINPKQYTLKADDDYIDSRGDMVRLNGESADGVAFARSIVVNPVKWYAGLLADVSLGNPVSHTAATAQWVGQVGLIKDGINSGNAYTAPLVLTVNFRDREISSPAIAIFADTLTINGRYDGHGLIRGTVSYATAGQTGVGHLTGLIGGGISPGAATAVGAFVSGASGDDVGGYSGGFVVREPHGVTITEKVGYGDWVHSFGTPPPAIAPNSPTTENQFLQGTDTTLPTAELTVDGGAVTTLDLDTATFDGVALGGDSADGVGFFQSSHHFAGLLSGTNLGDPLVAGSPKAYWNGQLQAVGALSVNTDFTLEVDFNPVVAVADSVGSIKAFVVQQAGFGYYHLTGTYDANGVIKGDVDFGLFTGGLPTMPLGNRISGTLRGLIGAEGAIGAFIADSTGYSGGFVAVPNARLGADTVAVNYNDWTYSFTPRPSIYLNTTNRVNQFLASHSGATALDETGADTINAGDKGSLTLATATFKGDAFSGGQAADGVSWFWDTTNTAGYAGILSSTDLGAPLSQTNGTAEWHGQFQATGGLSRDFILNIDFADSMITALVYHTGANHYHLAGSFGANGVITGTVKYGTFTNLAMPEDGRVANGILTGLIGAQGAVGAFISGTGDKNAITASDPVVNYAGGFVATPTVALDDAVVNYDDWARSFATLPLNQQDTITRRNQFLGTVTGATKLDDMMILGTRDSRKVTLTLPAAPADGVSFIWDNSGVVGYAGILSSTNLGAPLSQANGKAEWEGTFRALVGSFASVLDINRDFVLEIDFNNNANKIEAFVQQTGEYHYHLTGSFDANGVITGTVKFGTFTNLAMPEDGRVANGFLTGLIGADGAVGAFVSGVGTKDAITAAPANVFYSGGFVAGPPAPDTDMVEYNDWWRSFATLPPRQLDTTTRGNQFLRTVTWGQGLDWSGTTAPSNGILSLTGVFEDTTLNGEYADRVGFFWDQTNQAGYAGIHHTTNLGGRLVQGAGDATVEWAGVFQALNKAVKSDFVLTINFADNPDSISAFVKQAGDNYYHLTGSFDANGVITGEVNYGTFNTNTRVATGDRLPNGILTGLIGSDGAVGVFISGTGTKDSITATAVKYVGGFVASPTAVNTAVNYSDWTRSFGDTPLLTTPETSALQNQFLQGLADTLPTAGVSGTVTTLDLATANLDGIALGGESADGVGFLIGTDTGGSISYAGIFNGTDLGAPLVAGSEKAYWNGQFIALGVGAVNTNFTLEVDFNVVAEVEGSVGSIEAFVQQRGPAYYHLTGTYDSNGVIKGEVDLGNFTVGTRTQVQGSARIAGVLTGLIGSDGAVGTFISDSPQKGISGYAGGFVANETVADRVRFIDWTRSFGDTPPATEPSTTFENQFLQGTDTTLTAMATGLGSANDGTGTITPTLLNLSATLGVSGGEKNGVGFFEGYDNASGRYFYAGIFNGADLGAPLTAQTAAGVWKGKFQAVGANAVDTDFTLDVTFGADSTVPGSVGGVSAFIEQTAMPTYNYYLLEGTYDSNGVISGDVDFGVFTDGERTMPTSDDRVGGVLTGLIGSGGAIGAFHSTTTGDTGYAGGFVVCKRNSTDTACK